MRLTRDEMYLIAALVLALVTGAVVKQCRGAQRVEAVGRKQAVSSEQ